MKPILIFEHIESSGPGLFEDFLEARSLPYEILRPNDGDPVPGPEAASNAAGLCFCGGTESVTEPTPWMQDEIRLIQTAHEQGTPVIGHCLGGQLISKALGGEVKRQQHEEFGWSRLQRDDNALVTSWLNGMPPELFAMQWHQDSFSLPPGATRILTGEHCDNQAFVIGNMLGMQFHIEIDEDGIRQWAIDLADKHSPPSASVQSGPEIMADLKHNFAISKLVAEGLYTKWFEGVRQ